MKIGTMRDRGLIGTLAACAAALGLLACEAKSDATKPEAASAPAAVAALSKPMTFAELKLDFYPGPEVAPRVLGGIMDFTLSD